MAALTATPEGDRIPVGRYVDQRILVGTATGIAADNEWIPTGLSQIVDVIGWHLEGTTAQNLVPIFVLNAQGTGQTEGSSGGDLGVESTAAITAGTMHVTVRGLV